ncbi:choline/ethanolamine kinase family protein [Marinicella sp. W31]|uniref:choline/ethanolamine kinase family protein n=1 Tax=Marinicella sp. W31 TaxID=3023713 RepID=UPI00375807FE
MCFNKDNAQAYLSDLPEIRAAGLRAFESISIGTTNQNWKVETDEGVWVVRKNAVNVPGVDRHIEARILQLIEPLEIAPKLIAVNPKGGYLITEYLQGPAWATGDCANPALQKKLFEQLKPIHAIELNETSVSVRARVQQYLDLAPRQVKKQHQKQLYALLDDLEQLGFFEQQRLCHYDLNHTNIIGHNSIKILDWEFVGSAHPILDMAVFCVYEQVDSIKNSGNLELFQLTKKLVDLMFEVWHQIKPKHKQQQE